MGALPAIIERFVAALSAANSIGCHQLVRRIAVRFLFRLILFAAGAALAYQLVGRASGAYARTTCPHCGSTVGVFFPLEGMEVYCDNCNQPMVINKEANRWTAEAVS